MSKFNQSSNVNTNKTVNHEGVTAYSLSNEMELYTLVCTSNVSDKFYTSSNETLHRLRRLVQEVDTKFTAKLAIYAREQMYLRSIPLVLVVELAKVHSGDNLVSETIKRVVVRADEITELLAYYQSANINENKSKDKKYTQTKKLNKLSNQVKKGIRLVFESGKFDEYQYSKYNRKTEVKLRDALFLTHPSPSDKAQTELFKNIANDTLETAYTWESKMSDAGKSDSPVTSKKAVWEEMIDSNRMGYMATLRNLRNLLNEGVSQKHMQKVCTYLGDSVAVSKSKQLPFRFLSAYRMLTASRPWDRWDYSDSKPVESPYLNMVLEALEKAISHSIHNIPMFDGDTVLISTDVSASMQSSVSGNSVITMYDIGTVLSMMMYKKCKASMTGMFGDTFKIVNYPKNDILRNADDIHKREGEVGYSTNGFKVIDWANNQKKTKFDKIMMFTDCQLWNSGFYDSSIQDSWKKYSSNNPECKLYIFDLSGYGTSPVDVCDNNVTLLSGWSDKVFDVLASVENGEQVLREVKSIDI